MSSPVEPELSPLQRTRAALVSGAFGAGEKLKPDHLRQRFGISASAMREVLLQLVGEGLVELETQRGFRTPAASRTRARELARLRAVIECEGARAAIARGDLEWEARLNAAHHKLSHIEARFVSADKPTELEPIWSRADNEFHQALVEACGSASLMALRTNLFHRSRQQVFACCPDYGFRAGTVDEHATILRAALARDAAACEQAICDHCSRFLQFDQRPVTP